MKERRYWPTLALVGRKEENEAMKEQWERPYIPERRNEEAYDEGARKLTDSCINVKEKTE